jgi:hypothetical protein
LVWVGYGTLSADAGAHTPVIFSSLARAIEIRGIIWIPLIIIEPAVAEEMTDVILSLKNMVILKPVASSA